MNQSLFLLSGSALCLFFVASSSCVGFGYGQTFGELGNKIVQVLVDQVE
ncbi:MAG: hypothetical protein ACPKQO_04880 [Nitrososphaeraceae archaeon]